METVLYEIININNSINETYREYKKKKVPKFINRFIFNRRKKKIKNMIDKVKDYTFLDYSLINQFVTILHDFYPPHGAYNHCVFMKYTDKMLKSGNYAKEINFIIGLDEHKNIIPFDKKKLNDYKHKIVISVTENDTEDYNIIYSLFTDTGSTSVMSGRYVIEHESKILNDKFFLINNESFKLGDNDNRLRFIKSVFAYSVLLDIQDYLLDLYNRSNLILEDEYMI